MSDKFSVIPPERLFQWILREEEQQGTIFGIRMENIFRPSEHDPFRLYRYGKLLETPLGVAAGPHSQLAQNIITAWLTGARYLELKTVQTLDELEVSKPCIDMEDEGYNCEWSQELKLDQSFDEYLKAWIILHVLRHKWGWKGDSPGFIFNMSVGYNLEGILKPNVQRFLERMSNCQAEKEEMLQALAPLYPAIDAVEIPDRISDNITLSTMHGCPPEEIEKIGLYLIQEKKFHTTVKLNPTLLGSERLRDILNNQLGFETHVPDDAFGHDLKYQDALTIIRNLQSAAQRNHVSFGLKLSNTLECVNHKEFFPPGEKMMYMSGRALHPLTVNLAAKLQAGFQGSLDISFAGGADSFNLADLLSCDLGPVTVCSDILKPGGYLRLVQYLGELKSAMAGTEDLGEFISRQASQTVGGGSPVQDKEQSQRKRIKAAALQNLTSYAQKTLGNRVYQKSFYSEKNIKTERPLTPFDCIQAPCVTTCPANQGIPDYMRFTAQGEYDKAFQVLLATNPFPTVTGMVCDHLCQTKCTRLNYDEPLRIRHIKRFITEYHKKEPGLKAPGQAAKKAAVIGAGPAGLSSAYFLALEGLKVEVFETKSFPGGMMADAIPSFRLKDEQIALDMRRITGLGVKVHFNQRIDRLKFQELHETYDYIFVGVGAQKDRPLRISGEDQDGVLGALRFLSLVRRGNPPVLGRRVAVIGGGNSAMDAARSAYRLQDNGGEVTLLYRRTKAQMPADREELNAVREEGILIRELTSPLEIRRENQSLALVCQKMKLGRRDQSGRPAPIPVEGSGFELNFDTIITALGQEAVLDFLPPETKVTEPKSGRTNLENVFLGGDALRGASSLIKAIGDGRKIAAAITNRAAGELGPGTPDSTATLQPAQQQIKAATRLWGRGEHHLDPEKRRNFQLVIDGYTPEQAREEAGRCLQCDTICDVCVTVCPNRANVAYTVKRGEYPLYRLFRGGGRAQTEKSARFSVRQVHQVLNIADFCNECGNCQIFCPTKGAPYKEKPRVCLTEESFQSEERGYWFTTRDGQAVLKAKGNGLEGELSRHQDSFLFQNDKVEVRLNSYGLEVEAARLKGQETTAVDLSPLVPMALLFQAVGGFFGN